VAVDRSVVAGVAGSCAAVHLVPDLRLARIWSALAWMIV